MDLTNPASGLNPSDAKAQLNTYDSDIIEWMRRDPKYCLRVQQMMDNFIADIFQQRAVISNVNDSFKRKLIHKLCDRYTIERFVDTKKGLIVIQKTAGSMIPKQSLKDYFNEYSALKKSIPEKKIILRTRESNLTEREGLNDGEDEEADLVKEHQKNQKQKLDDFQAKNEHYLKIKNKYFEGQAQDEEPFDAKIGHKPRETAPPGLGGPSSKLQLKSKAYDPDFIRDDPPRVGQSPWQTGQLYKNFY